MPDSIKAFASKADWPKFILAALSLTIVGILVGFGKLDKEAFTFVLGLVTPKDGYTKQVPADDAKKSEDAQ